MSEERIEKVIYRFGKEEQEAYERLAIPMGIFQHIGNKIVAILVSDGLCSLAGRSRTEQLKEYENNMFGKVHPDDLSMIAEKGYRFAREEGEYNIIYRTKLRNEEEYRYINAVGRMKTMENGVRLAFMTFSDVTEATKEMRREAQENNEPLLTFFNENLGPIVILGQKDKRLIYHNQAVCNMFPPKMKYESGITFEKFFFGRKKVEFNALYNAVDNGVVEFEEPYTQRRIEANVISSSWGKERVLVIYFYEVLPKYFSGVAELELRHKRMAFHNTMFIGKQRGESLLENGYQGLAVWNLTQNEIVFQKSYGWTFLKNEGSSRFNDFFLEIKKMCVVGEEKEYLNFFTAKRMLLAYWAGAYPRELKLTLQTQYGQIYVSLEITMMESPDTGDVYIKIWEENVTEKEIIRMLLAKTLEQKYDYIAYLDVLADRCWILGGKNEWGKKSNICIKASDYGESAEVLHFLEDFLDKHFHNLEEILTEILTLIGNEQSHCIVRKLPDGSIKNIQIHLLDRKNLRFYFCVTDVTVLLELEKKKEYELEQARIEALQSNARLQIAVQEERKKVESTMVQTVLAASKALDARDPYTSQHSERVAKYASEIARKLNWESRKIKDLYYISLVHDIGKIGISDALLLKPGPLTAEEFEIVKEHVMIGSNIMKDFTAIDHVLDGILYHHERYDGKGYISGLMGKDIPIEARIICVADSVDAMYSTRPYRKRQSIAYIKNELVQGREKQFDPELVEIMLELIEEGILEEGDDTEREMVDFICT